MSHPRTQLQRVGGPDTEDNDRVRHPQTENDRNQKDTDETASWKRRDRPWFALLEFALSVEVPRGIADERDSADRTVTPTGNKTKMNGFVEISTLLIHSAPKQKSNEWMHLSPFYTRMHGEWLRYAKSTSQFHWRFLLVRDVRGFQVNPLCRHDITRSDRQIGNKMSRLTHSDIYKLPVNFNWGEGWQHWAAVTEQELKEWQSGLSCPRIPAVFVKRAHAQLPFCLATCRLLSFSPLVETGLHCFLEEAWQSKFSRPWCWQLVATHVWQSVSVYILWQSQVLALAYILRLALTLLRVALRWNDE